MSETNDWNAKIVDEFRANAGKLGGPFEGADTIDVRARVAEGDERERIWEKQKQLMPGFAEYEAKTTRQIPVLVLERV